MKKKLISDFITVAGVLFFILGVVFLNIYLIIIGAVTMGISIFIPY